MTFRFHIPGRLPGTNEIIRDAARNRFKGGQERKKAKTQCYWTIMEQNLVVKACFTKPVRVSFAWVEPNARRDIDNVTGGQKVILDALVMAKVLVNDTRQYIREIDHTFPEPDKDNPRIEVTVTEIESLGCDARRAI